MLTAKKNGAHIGYLNYSRGLDSAFVNHIEVYDEYRKKGYGKALVSELRKYYPRLQGASRDEKARMFWKSLGAEFEGKRKFEIRW